MRVISPFTDGLAEMRRGDLAGGTAQHFLVQLGEFAGDGDGAARQCCFHVLQRLDDAVRAFEEDERRAQLLEFGEELFPLALLLRHEAREGEAVGGQARKVRGP
jgi:hypothetical protein